MTFCACGLPVVLTDWPQLGEGGRPDGQQTGRLVTAGLQPLGLSAHMEKKGRPGRQAGTPLFHALRTLHCAHLCMEGGGALSATILLSVHFQALLLFTVPVSFSFFLEHIFIFGIFLWELFFHFHSSCMFDDWSETWAWMVVMETGA